MIRYHNRRSAAAGAGSRVAPSLRRLSATAHSPDWERHVADVQRRDCGPRKLWSYSGTASEDGP